METRNCQNCKYDFIIAPDDFSFYEKMKIPAPTWCWKCRAMRRMSYRNMRYLYLRVCDATGKKIFIPTPPEAKTPVYDPDYWMSDQWDAGDYARDYDFTRPFFEQFKELFDSVPTSSTLHVNIVNSNYTVGLDMKNCYMCFDSGFCEDSVYGVSLQKSRQCLETINCKACELCYWMINGTGCYRTFFSRNCTSCVDVWFSQDCSGCTDCFGCANLRNKTYYIFNEPYSKEEYEKKIKEFDLMSSHNLLQMKKQIEDFWSKKPVRFRHGLKDVGCTGDYIYNAAELRNCFFSNGAKNCAHSQSIIYDPIADSMDLTSSGIGIELAYEVSGSGETINRVLFAADSHTITDSQYVINCRSLSDCFGCAGLKSRKYCILNKQYTKDEYNELLPKVIQHMKDVPYIDEKGRVYEYGEFFPPHMSLFHYNESQGYEYFPLDKEKVEEMGFNWRTPLERNYAITLSSDAIPDRIDETLETITAEVIGCAHDEHGTHSKDCGANCATAFKITAQELQFYRQMNLPLPRLCFNCRHIDRIGWRNSPALYKRSCDCESLSHNHEGKCPNEFETSYAPDRAEIVYCESCYQQEMVQSKYMETRNCQNCKNDFEITADDFGFYQKAGVPVPTLCPRCRRIRRLTWRNDFSLYSRSCAICQKNFVSIYAPNTGFTVLCPKCFHSDAWDPYEYGMIYDPNRSFVDQVVELYRKAPVLGVVNDDGIGSINCMYTNDLAFAKNCAMVFIAWHVENVFNSMSLNVGKDLSDCMLMPEESQYVYDGVMANGCSNCKSVYWCNACIGCNLCYDCRGCSDCFMSTGLRNKKYYFKNTQYTKEEYHTILDSYKLDTRSGYENAKKEFAEFVKSYPRKFAELQNSVNCTGSDIVRGKNTKSSNFASFSEDSKYVHNGVTFKGCYDCEIGGETEFAYECITPDQSFQSLVTVVSWKNTAVSYCFDCHSSNNLLGCSGIKKGEYSILNTRYSKEEYLELSKKIIEDMKARGEYGEFFPSALSPFGINETRALDQLGITKEEAIALGYNWQEEIQHTMGKETISQDQVPDSIAEIDDSMANEILACVTCSRNYRIIPDELTLYRRLSVPIPKECFFCRNAGREKMRGGYDLVKRQCDCSAENHGHTGRCPTGFETFFTEKEPRPIYCEKCYQQEVAQDMETKNCQSCKKDFVIDSEDVSFYAKTKVPHPTWCPKCRMIRRFNYRNARYLFRRPDFLTGKEIFSGFSKDSNVRTIENSAWYGTDWDPLEYGFPYDFSKPFFEQLHTLQSVAPLPARSVYNLINSDYSNEASELKNCYLCFNVDFMENCAYVHKANHMKDCLDVYECMDDELCYESVMVDKCYQTILSVDCESCVDVWFSKGLRGCTNCFGCANLRGKSYYFFNEPCTKEEYMQKIADLNLKSYSSIKNIQAQVKEFWKQFPNKYNHNLRILDCTGERIFDSKNVKDSYSVKGGENLRYCQDIQATAANSYDYSVWGAGSENMYECMTCGLGSYNLKFCFNCWENARDLEYCIYCMGSKDCFGCVGLYKKQYCIFNVQYTKEEYTALREKIIAHMDEVPYIDPKGRSYRYGEFFPVEFTPQSYNETIVNDFYPLTKERAEEEGYIWREPAVKDFPITINAADLPDNLLDVDERILQEVISCTNCSKAYKIVPFELQFYMRIGMPLPRLCPDCRYVERFKLVNPAELWPRTCMCDKDNHGHESSPVGGCPNTFESSYAPERSDIVYCEDCYQQEVS